MKERSLGDLPPLRGDGPLVSIIIPTYNTPADRLRRCIASVDAQTYQKLEVVLIDDGSDDRHRSVLNEIVRVHSHIRLVEGGHKGVSHARNVGIIESSGEWICFSDSDDEIAPNFIEEALRIGLSEGADLVCGAVCRLYAGGVIDGDEQSEAFYVVDDPRSLSSAARQMIGNAKYKNFAGPDFRGRGPVAKLYRRLPVGNIRFDEGIAIGEDTLFNYDVIRQCSTLVLADRVWYRYFQYASSTVHSLEIGPWVSSIDGILAACADDADRPAFITRCAFMSFQGVDAFVRGERHPYALSMELMRYSQGADCYSESLFDGFEPSRAYDIMARLCKGAHLKAAYLFWRANTVRITRTKNFHLIEAGG